MFWSCFCCSVNCSMTTMCKHSLRPHSHRRFWYVEHSLYVRFFRLWILKSMQNKWHVTHYLGKLHGLAPLNGAKPYLDTWQNLTNKRQKSAAVQKNLRCERPLNSPLTTLLSRSPIFPSNDITYIVHMPACMAHDQSYGIAGITAILEVSSGYFTTVQTFV